MKLRLSATALMCAAALTVNADPAGVDELRIGITDHDTDLLSATVEPGFDLSLEVLFKSPTWLKWAYSPRPNIGLNLNSESATNVLYFGTVWQLPIAAGFFGEGGLGIAFNDGEQNTGKADKRQLGCSVGFHESVAIGYKFLGHHQIIGAAEHASNGGFCPPNSGLTSLGLRYGYNF